MTHTRSGRMALLTENEREYLSGKIHFESKQRSKFLGSLLSRMEACNYDLNLIWNRRRVDNYVEGWIQKNWNEIYKISESIDVRKRIDQRRLFVGRIKFKKVMNKNRKRGIRLYWLDEKADFRIDYKRLLLPEHWLIGVKPPSVKRVFREAFELEGSSPDRQRIIPRSKEMAATIKEIRKKMTR